MNPEVQIPEELLSGYLDGTLVQQEEQRARRLLEESAEARLVFEDLKAMREAARGTPFRRLDDIQFSEVPRSRLSAMLRFSGFGLVVLWLAALTGFGLWRYSQSADSGLWEKLMVFGLSSGILLAFLSVLSDRLRDAREDPYRGVKK